MVSFDCFHVSPHVLTTTILPNRLLYSKFVPGSTRILYLYFVLFLHILNHQSVIIMQESCGKQPSCQSVRNMCVLAHVDHGLFKLNVWQELVKNFLFVRQNNIGGQFTYKQWYHITADGGQTSVHGFQDRRARTWNYNEKLVNIVDLQLYCFGGYAHVTLLILRFSDEKDDQPASKYFINIIDSPGHVDFFGEVSTALRICDGCVILVDVIEGVCSQTRAALQQAWLARVKPILILNKIDRLFIERKMEPLDIYIHLTQTLEQVNSFVGELFSAEVLSKLNSLLVSKGDEANPTVDDSLKQNKKQVFYDWSSGLDDVDDSNVYFSPENGNVLFASAIDGWGFTVFDFARILSKSKLGFSENVLKKTLWGDFYLNAKDKRIMKGAQSKSKKPLFVTLILENLSRVYEKFIINRDKIEMAKIAEVLNVKLLPRDLNHSDPKAALTILFSKWMPLSQALLKVICDIVPCPSEMNEERVTRIMCANEQRRFDSFPPQTQALKQAFMSCQASTVDPSVPLIVCVSKMFAFDRKMLPQNRQRPLTSAEISLKREQLKEQKDVDSGDGSAESPSIPQEENDVVFIAFARVFSGTIRQGDWVYVIGPKHDPSKLTVEIIDEINASQATLADLKSNQHVTRAQVKNLYLLMGRDLESIEEVHAGHICGIGGLENHIIKSAALSSTPYCTPFVDYFSNIIPILRVAVEPKNPSDMPALIRALRMLNQSDPCVDVKIQETGEHVIITTGEVHLERCIVDLTNFLNKEEIEFNISEPIVPFRETIIERPKVDMLNENISEQKIVLTSVNHKFASALNSNENDKSMIVNPLGSVTLTTSNKRFLVRIRAKPLPESVVNTLETNQPILLQLMQFQRKNVLHNTNTNFVTDASQTFTSGTVQSMHELRKLLDTQFTEAGWPADTVDKVWSVGPKFCGTNLLLNELKDFKHRNCFLPKSGNEFAASNEGDADLRYQFENSFINGFQLSTHCGPLCEEPLMGVAFIVEEWSDSASDSCSESSNATETSSDPFGPLSGQIMSTVKETCRRAFQAQPQRLMAAMFSCIIQINGDALGKFRFYSVLHCTPHR